MIKSKSRKTKQFKVKLCYSIVAETGTRLTGSVHENQIPSNTIYKRLRVFIKNGEVQKFGKREHLVDTIKLEKKSYKKKQKHTSK